jgi:hypothetical protein
MAPVVVLLLASSMSMITHRCAPSDRHSPRSGAPALLASKLGMGWADPASALAAAKLAGSQDRLFDRLVHEFGGIASVEPFSLGAGSSATVRGFEAPERRVAWCAALALRESQYGEDGARAATAVGPPSGTGVGCPGSSLTEISCWLTPSIEVPNLFMRAGIASGGIALEIDFRPRLNAAYGLAGQEPTTRDEFAQVRDRPAGGVASPPPWGEDARPNRGDSCALATIKHVVSDYSSSFTPLLSPTSLPPSSVRLFCLQAGLRSEYDASYFTAEARQWASHVRATPGAEAVTSVTEGVLLRGRRQFGGA